MAVQVSAIRAVVGDHMPGFNIKTGPYPEFPTDLQPPTMALLTTCMGSNVVEELVFDNRMSHGLSESNPRLFNYSTLIFIGTRHECLIFLSFG